MLLARTIFITIVWCLGLHSAYSQYFIGPNYQADTTSLFDSTRNRKIPLAIYRPNLDRNKAIAGVFILNHGYGQNRGDSYLLYSYLAESLASNGFYVISIQHELPTDALIPAAGKPQVVRMPFWESGADNIAFVIKEMSGRLGLPSRLNIFLIGHSNGGDMAALFATKHPGIIQGLITLDNRRMPLPRMKGLRLLSLRSNDQPADLGVLPTKREMHRYSIQIIHLPDIAHNDMDDHATAFQRKEILAHLYRFLAEK